MSPDLLDLERLAVGLAVESLDDTNTNTVEVLEGHQPNRCDRQWRGHPGLITSTRFHHVLVAWVGLEGSIASVAEGYGWNDQGRFPGLGVLTQEEYDRRRARVLAGKNPIDLL